MGRPHRLRFCRLETRKRAVGAECAGARPGCGWGHGQRRPGDPGTTVLCAPLKRGFPAPSSPGGAPWNPRRSGRKARAFQNSQGLRLRGRRPAGRRPQLLRTLTQAAGSPGEERCRLPRGSWRGTGGRRRGRRLRRHGSARLGELLPAAGRRGVRGAHGGRLRGAQGLGATPRWRSSRLPCCWGRWGTLSGTETPARTAALPEGRSRKSRGRAGARTSWCRPRRGGR